MNHNIFLQPILIVSWCCQEIEVSGETSEVCCLGRQAERISHVTPVTFTKQFSSAYTWLKLSLLFLKEILCIANARLICFTCEKQFMIFD